MGAKAGSTAIYTVSLLQQHFIPLPMHIPLGEEMRGESETSESLCSVQMFEDDYIYA